MIDLAPEHLIELKRILNEHFPGVEVRVFGSRIQNKAEKYSDLDLVLVGKEKLDWRRLEALKDTLAESNLPFVVDVLDWYAISPEFRKIIAANYENLVNLDAPSLRRIKDI